MDTRFWGPSGWQLLHLIAAENLPSPDKKRVFIAQQYILPCRFCRESTMEFMSGEFKYHEPAERWLYDLHNRVNKKLRDQCRDDPKVICPPADPSFGEIQAHYADLLANKPTVPPGMDFLFCVVFNYKDKDITPEKTRNYREFFEALLEVYPFEELRAITKQYKDTLDLTNRKSLSEWFKKMMGGLCKATGSKAPCVRRYSEYSSSCKKGKTCRNGKKQRNHRRTYKLTHSRLLH
jgi:hypothetical protein